MGPDTPHGKWPGAALAGEVLSAGMCGHSNSTEHEAWLVDPSVQGPIRLAASGLCLSFDMSGAHSNRESGLSQISVGVLEECATHCATSPFDIVVARVCTRQCTGGSPPQATCVPMNGCSCPELSFAQAFIYCAVFGTRGSAVGA